MNAHEGAPDIPPCLELDFAAGSTWVNSFDDRPRMEQMLLLEEARRLNAAKTPAE